MDECAVKRLPALNSPEIYRGMGAYTTQGPLAANFASTESRGV